jgi:hypothetical protein
MVASSGGVAARTVSAPPRPAFRSTSPSARAAREKPPKREPKILFQKYFKSVGPRTYAAQLMEAGNGNHYLVLTEGKRDDKTGEVRKTRLFVFSEDFAAFKAMLGEMFTYIQSHPVPDEVRRKREKFWAKQRGKEAERQDAKPAKAE